jgi:hypothetical protein
MILTLPFHQSIFQENAQTMINLQHQFCVASCDLFAPLMVCSHCNAVLRAPHENDCSLIQQHLIKGHASGGDPRSSAQFDRGSSSTQGSSEHQSTAFEMRTSPSCYLDNIRGPLPNPGHLLGMKLPYRGSRSPLNFPLFPLNGQARRWSEAAASESILDPESQMRRWSMPDKTVHWSQTRIMPISISKLAVPSSKMSGDRSQSTTPDSTWQSSVTSQDGLAEAIQLLSCRPLRMPSQSISHPPAFIEEPASQQEQAEQSQQQPGNQMYGMWQQQSSDQQRLPPTFPANPPFPMKYIREHQPPYDGKF